MIHLASLLFVSYPFDRKCNLMSNKKQQGSINLGKTFSVWVDGIGHKYIYDREVPKKCFKLEEGPP